MSDIEALAENVDSSVLSHIAMVAITIRAADLQIAGKLAAGKDTAELVEKRADFELQLIECVDRWFSFTGITPNFIFEGKP